MNAVDIFQQSAAIEWLYSDCGQASLRASISGASKLSIRGLQPFRTIFELQAGRRDSETPENLSLDEVHSFQSDKNDHPRVTSKDLIEALGSLGVEYETPKQYVHRNDLSYSNALTAVLDWREAQRQVEKNAKLERDKRWGLHPKDVLVDFLRHVTPALEYQERTGDASSFALDRALLKVFHRRNERYFMKKGWDVTDLMNWAWILSGRTTEQAAARLARIGRLGLEGTGQHRVVPQFVCSFLLRRQTMSAPALTNILEYLWDFMAWISERKAREEKCKHRGEVTTQQGADPAVEVKDFVFIVMFVRLLRHTRKLMPTAYEGVVSLLCRFLDDCVTVKKKEGEEDDSENRSAALTFIYNSALVMIAYPSSLHPFRSATHQQRAQFMILRKMTQYDPPLLVDRRGYRAVTRVQLMQKKTHREREWALLKASSWPPWKENRLGIDADIGPEYGISQAKEVLNQAKEAGYAANEWDDAASILAGWDTDDSPTIQNKGILGILHGELLPESVEGGVKRKGDRHKSMVWAARIKATRTLQEAWAAFLSYEDSGLERFDVVYYAMFEKLFYDSKRKFSNQKRGKEDTLENFQPSTYLAGDGPEVFPTPIVPHHTVYNRTPPPSIEEFTQNMIDNGIRPTAQGGLLYMLLQNAPTLALGFRFLTASTLPLDLTTTLLTKSPTRDDDLRRRELLKRIPIKVFDAVIQLFTRFARGNLLLKDGLMYGEQDRSNARIASDDKLTPVRTRPWRTFDQAVWLLLERKPRERTPWYAVLATLSRGGVISPLDTHSEFHSYSAIANWKTIFKMLNVMEDLEIKHDLLVMKILGTGLEKAIFECETILREKDAIEYLESDLRSDVGLVLEEGLPRLKDIFKSIVRSEGMQQAIPKSVLEGQYIPEPALNEDTRETNAILSDDEIDGGGTGGGSEIDECDDDLENDRLASSPHTKHFLPPACLLPKILEIPDTSQLHSFMRILGLRRDYQGILDLVEWMALYKDEIQASMEETPNGSRMMRRCLTAARVFLERSWTFYQATDDEGSLDVVSDDIEPAPIEIRQTVQDTILETSHWGGWPTDSEVEHYCLKGKFV